MAVGEPIEMTAIRNNASTQDAGPGSGVQESRAIVAYVDKILLDLGNARGLVERAKAREDVVRREAAEAKQIRASSDNVRYNAEQRVLVYWRDLFNGRTFTKRLLDLLNVVTEESKLDEEQLKMVAAAASWLNRAAARAIERRFIDVSYKCGTMLIMNAS